ncbi:N-acetyltransferase [Peribacillus cavernae]|uniref:N-acetyltransferase n=1 Tax=Peribacillus cavernae TaxID=1674310 RepID=A0A3S0VQF3_9BACI|nr:GNAT family protein [Peribacillus cavernae]MDQ0216963.1 RimJ/RimL family protein N-acetyltransferase [Peribacillus cavernae]RUQ30547.1 N-acetyltransferase [Peribacillus cavernae]
MTLSTSSLFRGELVKLSAPREEDAEIMAKWEEDSEYLRNVDTDIALPHAKMQFEIEESPDPNEAYFRLRKMENDELIGFVVIHRIEWNNRAGFLAIGIGDSKNRNKGYGTEALQLILRFAFHELNLNRVSLDVIEYNKRAIHAYKKAGFQHEGRMRAAVSRDGKRYDRIIMGILCPEWEDRYQVK